jgi:hypothetical protein
MRAFVCANCEREGHFRVIERVRQKWFVARIGRWSSGALEPVYTGKSLTAAISDAPPQLLCAACGYESDSWDDLVKEVASDE